MILYITFSHLLPNGMFCLTRCKWAFLWCDFNCGNRLTLWFFMCHNSITQCFFYICLPTPFLTRERENSQLKQWFWWTNHSRSWSLMAFLNWIFIWNLQHELKYDKLPVLIFFYAAAISEMAYILLLYSRFLLPPHVSILSTLPFYLNAKTTTRCFL